MKVNFPVWQFGTQFQMIKAEKSVENIETMLNIPNKICHKDMGCTFSSQVLKYLFLISDIRPGFRKRARRAQSIMPLPIVIFIARNIAII